MKHIEVQEKRIPSVGLGTWRLNGAECRAAVEHALEVGYRHFDTARAYENEDDVGVALVQSGVPRSELFVTTKLWFDELDAHDVKRGLADSLERLRMDYVDLLLIHWPNPSIPLLRTLTAMLEEREAGRCASVGVSNFPSHLHEEASILGPVLGNQVEYHPYLDQRPILAAAGRHDQMVTAYSPLARGQVFEDPVLRTIGEAHGKSPGQVALRWLIDQPAVAVIPRSSKPQHIESNFDIFDFELDDAERSQIDALQGGRRLVDPEWAPAWDEPVYLA